MENRTNPPSTPSLARRYICKLLANVASVPVYLAMEAILPRALGPAMYGNYSFATNFFQQLFMFLDMGTSTCFYNALSRRQSETGLISFYMRLCLLIAVISLLIAGAMQVPLVGNWLMPDVPLWLAPLAAIWAFLTWWGRVLRSMNDAVGATVQSEMVRTVVSLSAVFLLIGLFLLDGLLMLTSSSYGIAAALRAWRQGKLHPLAALLLIAGHCIFVVDVVSSWLLPWLIDGE